MGKKLANIKADAASADLHTKIRCLKKLGDLSLYTAGFFGESINRKIIDIDYYIGMGGSAYMSLSAILQNQKTFAELYLELAELFPNLVDVLAEGHGSAGGKAPVSAGAPASLQSVSTSDDIPSNGAAASNAVEGSSKKSPRKKRSKKKK